MAPVVLGVLLLLLLSSAHATPVVFVNTQPVLDVHGATLDAHDQSIRQWRGDAHYYRHAVAYGGCQEPPGQGCDRTSANCGFEDNHTINVWRSLTMASGSWEPVGPAIVPSQRPAGIVFRPSAILNVATNTTVLMWNTNAAYPVAVSTSGPAGPFTTVVHGGLNVSVDGESDFQLFRDDQHEAQGYIIYSAGFKIHIEALSRDFLSVRANASYTFAEYFVEAPTLFVRNGVYYALFSWCCCFCKQGSGIIVHTAPHPLGPWTTQGDVACVPSARANYMAAAGLGTDPTPGEGCEYKNSSSTSATRAQQNGVVEVNTVSGETAFLWIGDRWQQSWDGTKGHDPQIFLPLDFNDDGSVAPVRWLDSFTVDVEVGDS